MFYTNGNLALFIDGTSTHAICKELGFEVDYKHLLAEFARRGKLNHANYYSLRPANSDQHIPLKPLHDWLSYNGFRVTTLEYTDDAKKEKLKIGCVPVRLSVDALAAAKFLDHVVLFVSEETYIPLVESLQQQGCRVSIVSSTKTERVLVDDVLRRAADNFIDLKDLKDTIGKQSKEQNPVTLAKAS